MKPIVISLLLTMLVTVANAQQTYYDITAGNGYGIRFWQSDWFKIHMGNAVEYHYGPVTDYSIKANMSNDAGRGWTWGVAGATPVKAVDILGNMQIAGAFSSASDINVGLDGSSISGYGVKLNLLGASSNSDALWLSRFNGGSNVSELRVNVGDDLGGDDSFVVGTTFFQDGQWKPFFKVRNDGNIGIGTTSPNAKLHIISQGAGTAGLLIQGQNGDNWFPYSDGKNYLRGTTVLADVGGNVGIGTTTPNAKLHINGNGGSNVDLLINGRITTGDASSAGGMYVNSAQSMFVGQSSSTALGFYNNGAWRLTVDNNGSVGIGTTSPDAKLAVAGQVHAQEIKVSVTVPGPDYVFEKEYKLTSLDEIKNYIDQNKHLPEVPSAKEMEKNGVQLGEMNMLLLKKIEELTLYMIQQQRINQEQSEEIINLKKLIQK
jgi:hypothetical protein